MQPPEVGTFKAVALPQPQTVRARCFGVIDLGTVDNTYPGKAPKRERKVMLLWELPDLITVFNDDIGQQPFSVMKEMKYSTHIDSNLSKLISAWRNRPLSEEEKLTFDPQVMINKIGLLSFVHKRKGNYASANLTPDQVTNQNTRIELNSISPLPEMMKQGMPPMMNPPISWDWDSILKHGQPFDVEKFKKIFKFLRTKIYTSDEFSLCPTAVNVDAEAAQAPVAQQPQGFYTPPTQVQPPIASSQPPQGQADPIVGGNDDWS